MPFIFTMPKLSPTMEEGTLVKWHKKVNDYVEAGDLLIEVATDKATVEHNALDGGWLRKILVEEGHEAQVNQPIAIFTEEKEESIEGFAVEQPKTAPAAEPAVATTTKAEEAPKPAQAVPAQPAAALAQPKFVPEAPLQNYKAHQPAAREAGQRLLASPLARKLAKERQLDLSSVKGSGPGGRVMSRDLDKAQPAKKFAFSSRPMPAVAPGSYEEIPLTPIRKVISQRLQESKSFIPHFYVQQTVHARALVEFREQLQNLEIKVSFNDCVIRACALALRDHPGINAGFNSTNQTIVRFKTVDISVAVSLPTGLITPIIRYADYKNLSEISAEMRELANRAKAGKLEPQEYKGGSFTVSNLGMFGVTDFQAIINPPQAAILAISGIQEAPVVSQGQVVASKTMNITLSVDHRVIDGVAAAEFIRTVQKYLENPLSLVL